ncbi:hypothetical protein AB0876_17745 [Mycobacterium sp. NPDC049093]
MAAVAVLISGCGGGGGPLAAKHEAPKFSSTADIQAALNDAGLTCSDFKEVAKSDSNFAEQSTANEVANCAVEGEKIDLITFKDKGQQDNWLNMSRQMGCVMGSAFGVSNMHFVRGNGWGVAEGSQTISDKIADAIGGEAVHVDCKDVKLPGN